MHFIGEIQQLKVIIKEKEKIEELESSSEIHTHTFTHKGSSRRVPPEEQLSLEQQRIRFFSSKCILLDSKNIAACDTLLEKAKYKLRKTEQKTKYCLICEYKTQNWKKKQLEGTDVFVNERLTKKNAEIAYQTRILKKERKRQAMD